MGETEVVERLLERVRWHEAEAARIRSAAEVVAQELGVPMPGTRTRQRTSSAAGTLPSLILSLLAEQPREWTVAEMVDAMVAAGVDARGDNVRVAARRLAERGQIVKLGKSTYVSKTRASAPTPDAAEPPPQMWPPATTNVPQMVVVG